jgi:ADP-ribose pyrophosphatase YjhB (NUDIX family)
VNVWLRLFYLIYRIYIFIFRPVTYGTRTLLVKDGGIQRGGTVETAARHEVREEAGAEMGQVQLMGVYSNIGKYLRAGTHRSADYGR